MYLSDIHDANESQNTSELPLTVSKYNARKYTHAHMHKNIALI